MVVKSDLEKLGLSLESSLQVYFFDRLSELNSKMSPPLKPEIIYYSARIMDKFGDPKKLFEKREGRVSHKILGTKLLEATNLEPIKKKRVLKDIGDTALFMTGYFNDNLNGKLVDASYYVELGRVAYKTLDSYVPSVYEVDSFYSMVSSSFSRLTNMMSVLSNSAFESQDDNILIIKAS